MKYKDTEFLLNWTFRKIFKIYEIIGNLIEIIIQNANIKLSQYGIKNL